MNRGLYFQQAGRGQDVVLVHGWGFHGAVWHELAGGLAEDFRVTVVDLPGHGKSRDLPAQYSLAALAELILEIFRHPVIWIGWSLGAMVGLAAAHARPPAITNMVLVGATPKFVRGYDWPHGMARDQLEQFAVDFEHDYRRTLLRFLSLQAGSEADARVWLRRLRAQMFDVDGPTPTGLRAALRLLQDTDLRAHLASVTVPVEVIHGGRDRLVPLAAAQYLASRLPEGRLVTIAASGHAPFLSHAQLFQQALTGFICG